MDDTSLCDDIIKYFQRTPEHVHPGYVGDKNGKQPFVNPEVKKSQDMQLNHNRDLYRMYMDHIKDCVAEYYKIYEWADFHPITDEQQTNIQYYEPHGGYFRWHAETCSAEYPMVSRHLTYMTYLNDVTDAGETEFYYQNLKVKPEKGLTLIWTGNWMHTHRGIPSPTQEKYIVTGWLNLKRETSTPMELFQSWGINNVKV